MTPVSDSTPPTAAPPSIVPVTVATTYRHRDFLRFLRCAPFYWMLALLVVEAALAATTTALIIAAGRDVAEQAFLISDFVWIVVAQSASYVLGATSWIFAERAGFGA